MSAARQPPGADSVARVRVVRARFQQTGGGVGRSLSRAAPPSWAIGAYPSVGTSTRLMPPLDQSRRLSIQVVSSCPLTSAPLSTCLLSCRLPTAARCRPKQPSNGIVAVLDTLGENLCQTTVQTCSRPRVHLFQVCHRRPIQEEES